MKTSAFISGLLFAIVAIQSLLVAQSLPPCNFTWIPEGTSMGYESCELTIDVHVAQHIYRYDPRIDSCKVAFYLSDDTLIDTLDIDSETDVFLGFVGWLVYTDGMSYQSHVQSCVTFDISPYPGTWYVGFIIDYENRFPETNENDNKFVWLNPITVISPGLPKNSSAEEFLDSGAAPREFILAQNCANPFNPTTTIEYFVPEDSHVKIQVYNALGHVVDVLVDERKQAGFYCVQWNASGFPSGIYFYTMEAGQYKAVRRMTLMK